MPDTTIRNLRVGGRPFRLRVATPSGLISLPYAQDFGSTSPGSMPSDWSTWASSGTAPTVASGGAIDGTNDVTTGTGRYCAAWVSSAMAPADCQVSVDIQMGSLSNPSEGSGVFARASNPGSNTAQSGYFLLLTRDGQPVNLVRFDAGVAGATWSVSSGSFITAGWIATVTLRCLANNIRVQVFAKTGIKAGLYLQADGTWLASQAWCINVTDSTYGGPGYVGLRKQNNGATSDVFDNFNVQSAAGDTTPPTVSLTYPTAGATLSGGINLTATAADNIAVASVSFSVDGTPIGTVTSPTAGVYTYSGYNTIALSNGSHTFSAQAIDTSGNLSTLSSATVTASNNISVTRPTIANAQTQLKSSQLAYSGTPFAAPDDAVAAFIDVAVINPSLIAHARSVRPAMHMLYYANVGNLYDNILADWTAYARSNSVSPEDGFFHCASPFPYVSFGNSCVLARRFWAQFSGTSSPFSSQKGAPLSVNGATWPNTSGASLYVGHLERFREFNTAGSITAAAGGWTAVLEYCNAVDGSGHPSGWATLTTISDGTSGLTVAGRITWDPPSDWVPAVISGQQSFADDSTNSTFYRHYYIRWRVTATGTAPACTEATGRDFSGSDYLANTGSSGGGTGMMGLTPFFDTSADANSDGYLDDAEYANRGHYASVSSLTKLSGGITFTANSTINAAAGAAGILTVKFVNAGASQSLAVSVSGQVITVTLATDGSANLTSTVAQVAAAVNASAPALALLAGNVTTTSPTTDIHPPGTITTGKDARFVYESRMALYGDWRLAARCGSANLSAWGASYWAGVLGLSGNTDFNGFFMDNSTGKAGFASNAALESSTTYPTDYAACVNAIYRGLTDHPTMGARWVLMNIAGVASPSVAASMLPYCPTWWYEFALKPLADSWSQFETFAATVATLQAATSPAPIGMIDSSTASGGNTGVEQTPANLYNVLPYYYALSTPDTYLNYWGGENPAVAWSGKWCGAAQYDLGAPTAAYSVFKTGSDPDTNLPYSGYSLVYKVYSRPYTNAVVLFKPISYTSPHQGETGSTTATTHDLTPLLPPGHTSFQQVNPDGTLTGTNITSISLQNGTGAILVPQV